MRPHRPVRKYPARTALGRCLAAFMVISAGGCGPADDAPPPKAAERNEKAGQSPEMPEIPGSDDEKSGAADVLITDTTVLKKYAKPIYEQDETLPAGALRGLCFVPLKGKVELPGPQPIDVRKGPLAVRNPKPGEVDYYRKAPLRTPVWITYNRRTGRYGVSGAVLVIRGIRAGRRPPLIRTSFDVYARLISNYNVRKNPCDTPTIKFSAVKDRVMFRTYDPYPSHFVFRNLATGEVVLDKLAAGFTGGRRYEKWHGTTEHIFGHGVVPPHAQSPPLKELGAIYEMACKRHPWQKGYCFVVDSPYVAVSRDGMFTIEGVPVGKWMVNVWHPELGPARGTLEIEVRKNETTELGVEFKIPASLQLPPPQGQ